MANTFGHLFPIMTWGEAPAGGVGAAGFCMCQPFGLTRLLIAFCLCITATGCLREYVKQTNAPTRKARTVWQASEDNGDKPGFGIKLVDDAGRISATFFLLDPNKPHNFKASRAFPTEVTQSGQFELHFVVWLDENVKPRKDEFIIVLEGPLNGKHVNATLREVPDDGSPITLTFARQK